jgi:hypothetical protein
MQERNIDVGIVSDIDHGAEINVTSRREKSNRNLMVAQLLIATVTFVLLIFPDKAQSIAELIKALWTMICQLLAG